MFFPRKSPRARADEVTEAAAPNSPAETGLEGSNSAMQPAGLLLGDTRLSPLGRELAELYQETAASLFRYGLVLTRDFGLVQDAVQEVFLKYHTQRLRGEEIDGQKAWLFRVLRNYILDQQKSFSSKMSVALEDAEDFQNWGDCPEKYFERSETMQRIVEILSPRELQCLQLRTEGFSYKEIADILAIQTGTVGALLARCSDKIRREFGREELPCEVR